MTIFDMLGQSANLTVLGMGMVFGFLVTMIIAVILAGKVIHALHLDRDLDVPAAAVPRAGASAGAAVTAAITAAVAEYQKEENR